MSALDLARWQFAITSLYHFVFVPLTIGLAPLVAVMQTLWLRTGADHWRRLTDFFGKIFLLNFAIGVVTGIVQEFQFGMNWSAYSIFVGDIFGAPLAMEAMIAFFIESVFIGVWMFGRKLLSPQLHLASIWLVAVAVNLSAWFILAANSFMQHPVGTHVNPTNGRAELDSVWTMLTSPTALVTLGHTMAAALLTAGLLVAGVGGWWLSKLLRAQRSADAAGYRPAVRLGLWVALAAACVVILSGHAQGQLMVADQPMKMAAAEGLCHTTTGAGFSVAAFGNTCEELASTKFIEIPGLAAFLATNDAGAALAGVNDVAAAQAAAYGAYGLNGSGYIPPMAATYWSFRVMIGLGLLALIFAARGLWCTRAGATDAQRIRFGRIAPWMIPAPYLASLAGWMFTEFGRAPWIVVPNTSADVAVRMLIEKAVSPFVDSFALAASLVLFTAVYGVLAAIWFRLVRRAVLGGAGDPDAVEAETNEPDHLVFAY
ncbi:MAG: cytochrome ubiquinol oxidase subunit I [Actinobacteria bacterium HGW-Actinobacteria-2]|nr:MAG: cytochrome ubiquinol oxidase subunit I [Actinobacteria bacterium HGW-Actinobacteria-2]